MQLTDYFDRVYVINLPYKGDRRNRLTGHLKDTGIADPSQITWKTAVSGDWVGCPAWWGAGRGAWGCLLSHLGIVLEATMDGLGSYCVLEDDVVFQPDARERLRAFMGALPGDWGQIYLGGQFLHRDPVPVNDHVWRPHNINRTHAFALSRDTFGSFHRHIMHAPDYGRWEVGRNNSLEWKPKAWHIDHQLGTAHERGDWATYTPPWWIAGQEAGASNVSGRDNPRHWWHWWGYGVQLPIVWYPQGSEVNNADLMHFGHHLREGTYEDTGIARIDSAEAAVAFADTISREAVGMERLPGIVSSEKTRDWLVESWPAGVIEGPISPDTKAEIYGSLDPNRAFSRP